MKKHSRNLRRVKKTTRGRKHIGGNRLKRSKRKSKRKIKSIKQHGGEKSFDLKHILNGYELNESSYNPKESSKDEKRGEPLDSILNLVDFLEIDNYEFTKHKKGILKGDKKRTFTITNTEGITGSVLKYNSKKEKKIPLYRIIKVTPEFDESNKTLNIKIIYIDKKKNKKREMILFSNHESLDSKFSDACIFILTLCKSIAKSKNRLVNAHQRTIEYHKLEKSLESTKVDDTCEDDEECYLTREDLNEEA